MRHMILAAALLVTTPTLAHAPSVQVQNAWARATTPHAMSGGIFLTLTDNGAPDRLVGVSTPAAVTAQLHQTADDQGVMKMNEVPSLDLPPGKPVELKPGGYHIMLMGLKSQLKPGDMFPVTLTFAKAPPVTVTVTVGTAGASAPPPMGTMKMP
jgi:periplasmic copper chaperone A